MKNLEIKKKALSNLVSLYNVDDFTKEIASRYINNRDESLYDILSCIYGQYKSFATHLENIFNSNIENPTIKESLVEEYYAIECILNCIQTKTNEQDPESLAIYGIDLDILSDHLLRQGKSWLRKSHMLKDFEANGYKVVVSMTGDYLVHGHIFETIIDAHDYFFNNK